MRQLGFQMFPTLMLVVSISLFVLAGHFLYKGVDRITEADRQQQKAFLDAAVQSLKGDLAGTIFETVSDIRPFLLLRPDSDLEVHLAESLRQWQITNYREELIKTIALGVTQEGKDTAFKTLDLESGQFKESKWPEELEPYREAIHRKSDREASGRFRSHLIIPPLTFPEGNPALVLPLITASSPRKEADGLPRPALDWNSPGARFPLRLVGWCFLELDSDFLRKELLPSLIERHLRRPGLSGYRVSVVAGEPSRVLYSTDPEFTDPEIEKADVRLNLFNLRPSLAVFRRMTFSPPLERRAPPPPFPTTRPPEDHRDFPDDWILIAQHEAGSLEAALQQLRYRNLAIGFGLLGLLAGCMVMFALTAQRARALAQQRMEFVAGVTHELRTPLSILQSAGFNLTQELAEDPGEVRDYGELIQRESRRLTGMVEQILSFAGIQSGRRRYQFKPLNLSEIVSEVLVDYRPAFVGWEVVQDIDQSVPPVKGDAQAIRSAVKNLLDNALRYASEGKWLRVSVENLQQQVRITVQDRGPGIDPKDLPHLFEPFYRGRRVVASSTPGAGLGLKLVDEYLRAHGGRVTVNGSKNGGGAAFALDFPTVESMAAS